MSASVARRYARAAIDSALEQGAAEVEQLVQGLRAMRDAYAGSSELRELLGNPSLESERERVLELVLRELEVSKLTERLISLLAERDRIQILSDLASEVEHIADEQAGRLRARVMAATKLTDTQTHRIAKALEGRLGRPVVVDLEMAPELLGGLVCQVGDLTFDSSLKRQLELLRERLESTSH